MLLSIAVHFDLCHCVLVIWEFARLNSCEWKSSFFVRSLDKGKWLKIFWTESEDRRCICGKSWKHQKQQDPRIDYRLNWTTTCQHYIISLQAKTFNSNCRWCVFHILFLQTRWVLGNYKYINPIQRISQCNTS